MCETDDDIHDMFAVLRKINISRPLNSWLGGYILFKSCPCSKYIQPFYEY